MFVASRTTLGALPANLASSHLAAQRHQRSPSFKPSNWYCGLGVDRSFPRSFENSRNSVGDQSKDGTLEESSFKYTKEVLDGNQAILEFETQIDGKYVNGVDIITFNDQGKIIEFKVMIRPLQAVNIIHEKMQEMLNRFK